MPNHVHVVWTAHRTSPRRSTLVEARPDYRAERINYCQVFRLQAGPVCLVSPIAGAPLSAEQHEERSLPSEKGVELEIIDSKIFRDRFGRLRLDWFVGGFPEQTQVTYLVDPVALCAFMMLPQSKTAIKFAGAGPNGLQVGFPSFLPLEDLQSCSQHDEVLPVQFFDTIEAWGVRTTVTSNSDLNEQLVVRDTWRSQELQIKSCRLRCQRRPSGLTGVTLLI